MTLESKLQALVAHWKTESKRIKEMADKERSKASKDSLMAQSVRYWMCADELVEALLAERQEPPWNGPEICPKCGTSIYNRVIQCPKPDCGHIFAAAVEGKK